MLGKSNLLFLFGIINVFITLVAGFKKEVEEYKEVKEILERFNSITSPPATLFSIYLDANEKDVDSRYQFIKDLKSNMAKINSYGDFPFNPKGDVKKGDYSNIESRANENRKIISEHFNAIENSLKYLEDILSRYQYMGPDDKTAQSSTVIKHILGQTVLPEDSLPTRLPNLSGSDCLTWIDSELELLAYQYENNDPENYIDFEEYSKINLTKCLNYIGLGYSMVVSAKQANGDADAESFYEKYSNGISELITNHDLSVRKKNIQSKRKSDIMNDMYETGEGFTISKFVSLAFIITQLLFIILFN